MDTYKWRLKLANFYPPFFGAGIRLQKVNNDFTYMKVKLAFGFLNANLVGTQFGGSLFAMCDPWYMIMLFHHLRKEYIIWDKAATIRFRKPGKSAVFAEFIIDDDLLTKIRSEVDELGKKDFHFKTEVKNKEGEVIAEVDKVIYIKKK
ncbi:MAG TPA: tetrameric acyl-CoA thioesterase [Cytophagales bacterium]|jgi:hypothetical protein|nr:tetrameric acyl-CoA thioesterase [Cytophagales bacterium]